jgi:hypothetical protein
MMEKNKVKVKVSILVSTGMCRKDKAFSEKTKAS